jgi:hypothetical protein
MRHTPLLLILSTAFAFSQALPAPQSNIGSPSILYRPAPRAAGCPVSLFATRQGSPSVDLANTSPQSGPAQGLHLSLAHLDTPAIDSIEVTVYATSTSARVLPAGIDSPDLRSKTFLLHRTGDSTTLTQADVWMHKVGSIRWVDLIAINFTNGTTWHPAENSRCRIEPSNFVLVGQK